MEKKFYIYEICFSRGFGPIKKAYKVENFKELDLLADMDLKYFATCDYAYIDYIKYKYSSGKTYTKVRNKLFEK